MARPAAESESSPQGAVERRKASGLSLRIASALVLAPVALGAVWAGPPFVDLLVLVAGVLLSYEWERLCGGGWFGRSGYVLAAVTLAAVLAASVGQPEVGLIVAVVGAVAVYAARRLEGRGNPIWAALGAPYIGIPCIAVLWLRQDDAAGLAIILWMLAIVWATDIGAYAFGRMIGGPKLAPRISPNKTWSGLLGGVGCAMVVGAAVGSAWEVGVTSTVIELAVASGLLGALSQGGDLIESLAKRRFGVKDTSRLIPGHGGLFDRVDSLLVTAPAVALAVLVTRTMVP